MNPVTLATVSPRGEDYSDEKSMAPLPQGCKELWKALERNTVAPTYRAVSSLWLWTYTNKEYVDAVNQRLAKLNAVLRTENFNQVEKLTRELFFSKALVWIKDIQEVNRLNGISDFQNAKLGELQDLLIEKGASSDFYAFVKFFEELIPIAFAKEGGTCFLYLPPSDTGAENVSAKPNGILGKRGGKWTLLPAEQQPNQRELLKELRAIHVSLQKEGVDSLIKKLGQPQLFIAQALIGQLMTNYMSHVDQLPALSYQVFDQLKGMHALILKQLPSQTALSLPQIKRESFVRCFRVVRSVLRNDRFQRFYSEGTKVEFLKKVNSILDDFVTFHVNPRLMLDRSQLVFVTKDEKMGINLYLTGKEGDRERDLVMFFNRHNTFWDRTTFKQFSFVGGRATAFGGLEGLAHSQSLESAEKVRERLLDLLRLKKPLIGLFRKVRLIGYGLDGAIAQLIGYDGKKSYWKDKEVLVIGCGTPPYLDETAAAHMGSQMDKISDFHCLNYTMSGDTNIVNMGVTGPLGMRYDNDSAFTTVPVPQSPVFAGEAFKGDYRKAYMAMLQRAQEMHFAMRAVFLGADQSIEKLQKKARPLAVTG